MSQKCKITFRDKEMALQQERTKSGSLDVRVQGLGMMDNHLTTHEGMEAAVVGIMPGTQLR